MKKISGMKKNILAVMLLSAATSVMAAEQSVVSVSGNVTQDVCTIAAADIGKTVALGNVTAENLLAGTYTKTPFTFTFSGCDLGHTSVTAVATGTAADTNVSGYAGTASILKNTGTAAGVGVGLVGATSTTSTATGNLSLGAVSAAAPLTVAGNGYSTGGVMTLAAQIIPLNTTVKANPGTVVSTASMVFTYQ